MPIYLTLYQEAAAVRLYKEEKLSIKDIMKQTGIRSEQTIYRILDTEGVPRRPRLKKAGKAMITIEADVKEILSKEKNKSEYINKAVRFYHEQKER